jgi:hypothetical protein
MSPNSTTQVNGAGSRVRFLPLPPIRRRRAKRRPTRFASCDHHHHYRLALCPCPRSSTLPTASTMDPGASARDRHHRTDPLLRAHPLSSSPHAPQQTQTHPPSYKHEHRTLPPLFRSRPLTDERNYTPSLSLSTPSSSPTTSASSPPPPTSPLSSSPFHYQYQHQHPHYPSGTRYPDPYATPRYGYTKAREALYDEREFDDFSECSPLVPFFPFLRFSALDVPRPCLASPSIRPLPLFQTLRDRPTTTRSISLRFADACAISLRRVFPPPPHASPLPHPLLPSPSHILLFHPLALWPMP